jgi:hypothetical protein
VNALGLIVEYVVEDAVFFAALLLLQLAGAVDVFS